MHDARQLSLDLDEIAALLEFSGTTKFRVKAYRRAAEIVNTLGGDLERLIDAGRLQSVEGIGPALARQIEELWHTGGSELLARLRREQPEGAIELSQVQGLTPKRIRVLHDALGVRSVADLRAACERGAVRTVAGFGAKTEGRLLAAIARWDAREDTPRPPMLLTVALELAKLVRERLLEVAASAEVVGAARRGEETVRELEFVVVGDVDAALRQVGSLRQVIRIDVERRRADLVDGVTLVLHSAEPSTLGTALVRATGSERHVEALLSRARERGFTLAADEPFATETELYRALGCSFVPPELRVGTDELEQAETDAFADLVRVEDLQGFVHCHTAYSDGKNTVADMARAAQELGMKYITITDHSPSAHYAGGVDLDRLKAQWDEIAAAQEQLSIRILRGTESDILADGSLDYPDSVLEQFDVVIASIHARHRLDAAAMTARLQRALSLPIFKIWGHALGRILNHRAPIDCDVEAVLDALAGSRGAVEINADPHRLDLPPAWIPAARARGLRFVISVDAHSTRGFRVLPYGVTMARRGAVRACEVLNALPPEAFLSAVRPTAI